MLNRQYRNKGIGTYVFASEVTAMSKAGIKYIKTSAAGSYGSGTNGYYTWARLGFDDDIGDITKQRLPARLKGAKRVSDLMKTSEGRQ